MTFDDPTRVRLVQNGTTISESPQFQDRMDGFWQTADRLAQLDRTDIRAIGLGCVFDYRGNGIVDCRDTWFSDWRDLTVRVHPASGETWSLHRPPEPPQPSRPETDVVERDTTASQQLYAQIVRMQHAQRLQEELRRSIEAQSRQGL